MHYFRSRDGYFIPIEDFGFVRRAEARRKTLKAFFKLVVLGSIITFAINFIF